MKYKEFGEPGRDLLVFVHGGGLNGSAWSRIVERLPDFHCIVPDLPGHGESSDQPFSMDESVRALAELIREKAPDGKANIIGHSLGGAVVLTLLRTEPGLIERAVITGSSGKLSRRLVKAALPVLGILKVFSSERLVKMTLSQHRIPDEYYDLFYDDVVRSCRRSFLERIYGALIELEVPRTVSCPLLVCAGEKESGAAKLYGQISLRPFRDYPSSSCVLMPGGSHAWPMQFPEIFADMTRSWISGTSLPEALIRVER